MRFILTVFFSLLLVVQGIGQSNSPLPPTMIEVNDLQWNVEAQLQLLENQVEQIEKRPGSQEDQFVFVLAAPSAIAATADFILVAAAAGYISIQMRDQLTGQLDAIDLDGPVRAVFIRIREVFWLARDAKDQVLKVINEERLREHGYNDQEVETVRTTVLQRNSQCREGDNNNSPKNFCPDFRDYFSRGGYQIESSRGGYIVTRNGRFQCCLEWDRQHCGFEIFDRRGRHQGEVGCLEDEFNPCEYNPNRGRHAEPQPHNHRPRSQTCSH